MPGGNVAIRRDGSVSTFFSKKLLHLRASLGFRKGLMRGTAQSPSMQRKILAVEPEPKKSERLHAQGARCFEYLKSLLAI
jgi:hypothetical protein